MHLDGDTVSTLIREQRLFLDEDDRFDWPVEQRGKQRQFRVQWVFVTDHPTKSREVLLAGLLVLLNGNVSTDYSGGWINVRLTEIPEQVRGLFA
jgi:hypothetical protein